MYYVLYELADNTVVIVQDVNEWNEDMLEGRAVIEITDEFYASCDYNQYYIEIRDGQAYRSFECDRGHKYNNLYEVLENKAVKISEDKYFNINNQLGLPYIKEMFALSTDNLKFPYHVDGMYAGYITIANQVDALNLVQKVMKICALVEQFRLEKELAISNATTVEELNAIIFTDYPVMDATV